MTLKTTITTSVQTLLEGTAVDLGGSSVKPSIPQNLKDTITMLTGTAAGQADKVFADRRTVATGADDDVDLAAVLLDAFGAAITFVKVRAVIIKALPTNTTTLTISRPATAGAPLFGADGAALAPLSAGGLFMWADPAAGFTVTPTTDDIIRVTNSSGASAGYDIIVVGTSA